MKKKQANNLRVKEGNWVVQGHVENEYRIKKKAQIRKADLILN